MTEITFLASSRKLEIPREIEEYNFEREEGFAVHKIEDYWKNKLDGLFSMPYIYEAFGVGNKRFLRYLEVQMQIGDVFEIYHVRSQNQFDEFRRRMEEAPEPIEVNAGSYTYTDSYGTYLLNPKRWIEELSHRNYISEHGITTFVKYDS
ncbi:hypothetical protein [Mesobacillus jeotgali]|uniref:hypothetical protein n=1 Tax=Mesobacillus jeotgali TaxID=129985 RepID=UPI0009A56629|nr:hypothetical protein [Mesobacillus jeotgali]